MDDVKIPEFQGFLAGVLGSDKQYFSDVNKQEELRKKMLDNARRQQETREFMDNVPLRNAEDALKMDIARRKLPMVQEMLNADLGGKKAEIASRLSSARLHDTQADTSEYSINATRLDAINQILKKLPPDQALAMRMKLNPVMQQLMNRMVQRPAGEFVGSNELEATAGAGVNPPKTQQLIARLENQLEIAKSKNNTSEANAILRYLAAIYSADRRGGGNSKPVPGSIQALQTEFDKAKTLDSVIEKGMGLLSMYDDSTDPDGSKRAVIRVRVTEAVNSQNARPDRQPPAAAAKGSPRPNPLNTGSNPKTEDLPPGVTRDQ